jgi:thiol-disulfide isomerase/thioredoxin
MDAARLNAPAPGFNLASAQNTHRSLAAYKGKIVLINFWASWCAPCRSELPGLDSLRYEVADGEFAFVAINEEEDTAAARAFLDELGFGFPVAFGRGRMRPLFHYPGLPYTVLLDRGGRIAGRWIGYTGPAQLQAVRALIRSELRRGSEDRHGDRHGP